MLIKISALMSLDSYFLIVLWVAQFDFVLFCYVVWVFWSFVLLFSSLFGFLSDKVIFFEISLTSKNHFIDPSLC